MTRSLIELAISTLEEEWLHYSEQFGSIDLPHEPELVGPRAYHLLTAHHHLCLLLLLT